MLKSLIIILIIVAIPTAMFIVRFIRMLNFYKKWTGGPTIEERKVARINFIVHLITCIILFLVMAGLVYWLSKYLEGLNDA